MYAEYCRKLYGSSSKASFRHCIFGKFSTFTYCNIAERVTKLTSDRLTLYDLACQKVQQIPMFQQTTDEPSM